MVDTIIGQISVSNKRLTVFRKVKDEVEADVRIRERANGLVKPTAVRWDSSAASLQSLVDNTDTILRLNMKMLPFRDEVKKTAFAKQLNAFKNDEGGIRVQLGELTKALVGVRCANKDAQNGGITVGLFATTADDLINSLNAFEGSAVVKGIVEDIVTEFQERYNCQYPPDIGFAQYLIPEHAYFEFEEAGFSWPATKSDSVLSFIMKETLPAFEAQLAPAPLGPAIGSMAPGAARDAAYEKFQAAAKKEQVAEYKETCTK